MKRLLIADDDAGMRAALDARFARRGWQVEVASNGTEALEKFRSGRHALVITDVRMPGRDGFQLLREIQSSKARTAVILLTAYACVPDAVDAMRNGACDYGKIGDWIEKLGFASESEVTRALALQWGCPVAKSFDPSAHYFPGEIPLPILEAYQMLPLNYVPSTNTLYLAFGERVDHAALYAVEKILDCRTLPCVAGREGVARQLESMRQLSRPADVEFGGMDLIEMSKIASSYTARLSPGQVRLSRIGRFIWLRLDRDFKPATSTSSAIDPGEQRNNEVIKNKNDAAQDNRYKPGGVATNLVFRLPAEGASPAPMTRSIRDISSAMQPRE